MQLKSDIGVRCWPVTTSTFVAQPNTEARFDWDSWLVAAAAAAYVGIALILMLIGFRFPSDGWNYDDFEVNRGPLAVRNIGANGSALRPGDVVIRVDGQALPSLKTSLRPAVASDVWRTGGTTRYTVIRDAQTLELDVAIQPQPVTTWWRYLTGPDNWIDTIASLARLALAVFVFVRRPRNLGARALLLAFAMWLSMNVLLFTYNSVAVFFAPVTYFYTIQFFLLGWAWWFMPALIIFVLVFPLRKGPLRSHTRLTLRLLYGLPVALALATLLFDVWQIYMVLLAVMVVVFLAAAAVSTVHTLRTNHDPVVRAQLGWMALGLILGVGLPLVWFQSMIWLPGSALARMASLQMTGLQIALPLCATIAILRYRLFDIDIIINRALVYGTLTALVIGLYVFVVGYLGMLFRTEPNLFISLAATGLVAVLFQPLRHRLQRGVNRLMYGRRDEPVAVLSQLGARLEGTLVPGEILPGLVDTVAQALKLPYAAVALQVADQLQVQAESGQAAGPLQAFPLIYQGQTIGQLWVAPRGPGEEFNPADRLLLTNIARQAGAVAYAVQLTAALQQSRQELVTAREEERRRLRRDLHDGLGPKLASQTLTINAIGKLLERDPAAARELLDHLQAQSQAAIQDIRRLVYELRPPALDELGLVGALREGARGYGQAGGCVEITTEPQPLPALPAAVEVAVYRIAQEAITNVIRHARAEHCLVSITAENRHLDVSIADDGPGFPPNFHFGVGLNSMRERAEELGGYIRFENQPQGGARVHMWLPLPGEEE
jgi:signal transduction histidine kinase